MGNLDEISIKTIQRKDWDTISELSVNNEQSHFIETTEDCLKDAKNNAYKMKWNFYGIYLGDALIGFAMHGKNRLLFLTQVWLDRFMIDKGYQGKGYGKKAMELILEKMYGEYNCKKIYLSVHEDNYTAIELYKKLGFSKSFFKDSKGERIMTRQK